jgi:Sugar (and other) transporter
MVIVGVPMWMSEISPAARRGMLVDVHAIILILGYTMVAWVGYGVSFYTGNVAPFRILLGISSGANFMSQLQMLIIKNSDTMYSPSVILGLLLLASREP